MKHCFLSVLSIFLICALTACGGQGFTPFSYTLEEQVFMDSASAEDGTLVAEYRYSVPKMTADTVS